MHFFDIFTLIAANIIKSNNYSDLITRSVRPAEREYIYPKETTPNNPIKHQRDKQIFFVHRVDVQLFRWSEGG